MFKLLSNLRRHVAALRRDEQGNVSIEAVILLPLLLFLTTGGLTYWNAFNSNSRTAKVAYAVSDIVTRYVSVDDTDMAYLYALQDKMLPGNVYERKMRISSICFEDGEYHVMWSYSAAGNDTTALPQLRDEDVPIEVMPSMAPQDEVILVELTGSWTPQFLNVGIKGAQWNNQLVARPRFVKFIPHATLNPSNICPSSGT